MQHFDFKVFALDERAERVFELDVIQESLNKNISPFDLKINREPELTYFTSCYSRIDGGRVGDPAIALYLLRQGIAPQTINGVKGRICQIGFCEKEQKWYGWSHRARYGFGVGSTVKKGDCAYIPSDMAELKAEVLPYYESDDVRIEEEPEGLRVIHLAAQDVGRYSDEFYPLGRGEWTAETLDDAMEMAIAFARDIA